MNAPKKTIILGVDPGTIVTGYGLIASDGNQLTPIDYGCIRPPSKILLSERYLIIFNAIDSLIALHKPQAVIIETQYVNKNVQSALKLGMARGVILIAAKKLGIPVYEYAPTEAKSAVVGSGRASKYQVQGMVQKLLKLDSPPTPEDAADALALAICHAFCSSFLKDNHEV